MKKYFYLLLLFLFYNCSKEENDFLSLSCDKIAFTWIESVQILTIDAETSWYISSNLPSWITVSSLQGGSGSVDISVSVSDNDTGRLRFCVITFVVPNGEKQLQITQDAKEELNFIGNKVHRITHSTTALSVEINRNVKYEVLIQEDGEEWIKQVATGGNIGEITLLPRKNDNVVIGNSVDILRGNTIKLVFADNQKLEERYGRVIIYNKEYNLSDTLYIIQEAGSSDYFYRDGEYLLLQQAVKGRGVDLVFMGDGFTKKDLAVNGRYEVVMKQAIDYFFSIEPYQTFRDYFNIYMVIAESEEEGVNTANDWRGKIHNKFGTEFGEGTAIECNDELCFEYARKIKELKTDVPITVVMPLNSTKYAGTAYLYANGNSIALCPMSAEASPNDFEGVIHHEAGGHGFGFLCDEYVYYKAQMPESRKKDLREWQKYGYQMNLDFTNDISSILWKDFIGIPKYSEVGAYEGGYEYQYGVWRSEHNSCMNNNIPYYNVQSRWSIVSRIMKLAGLNFSVQDFIEADKVTSWPAVTRGEKVDNNLPPLGCPKWIK